MKVTLTKQDDYKESYDRHQSEIVFHDPNACLTAS